MQSTEEVFKRVVIVEDNIPLRNGFCEIINKTKDFKVIDAYDSCEEAIKYLHDDAPDIILMDIELPGMNGVEGTKLIKRRFKNTLIVVITVYENSQTVFDALCAGASGYLTKNISPHVLVVSLRELISGGAPMSIKIAKMVVDSFKKNTSDMLSLRETEVLQLLASGMSYKSIGETLFISINTIKFHLKNIYEKLQVQNREEAIKKANDNKLI